ncbi:MAG: lipopolysaccharide heptosyltransferase II [Verrucomicrobia bacterium]|nr:lipopolysaccharide heptosyltransferase II [Verrucomicrobiota bacterium]
MNPAVHPEFILVRSVNWLGDAVMTTPALLSLRRAYPSASISILCPDKIAELWWKFPGVDETLSFSPDESLWKIASKLKQRRFDLGIIFPNSFRTALEMALGNVRERVGFATNGRGFFLTKSVPRPRLHKLMRKRGEREIQARLRSSSVRESFPSEAHHSNHYLELVGAAGVETSLRAPRLVCDPTEIRGFADRFLLQSGAVSERPFFGINPGAEYGPAKRWPGQLFAEVASQLMLAEQMDCVIFGGPGDAPIAQSIETGIRTRMGRDLSSPRVINLAGQTSLRELMAGIRQSQVFLTNDSGPMHLAAALGTPLVAVFGSTSPELTGPGLNGDSQAEVVTGSAACAPCFLRECPVDFRCMTSVSPEAVVQALRRSLTASKKILR